MGESIAGSEEDPCRGVLSAGVRGDIEALGEEEESRSGTSGGCSTDNVEEATMPKGGILVRGWWPVGLLIGSSESLAKERASRKCEEIS